MIQFIVKLFLNVMLSLGLQVSSILLGFTLTTSNMNLSQKTGVWKNIVSFVENKLVGLEIMPALFQ